MNKYEILEANPEFDYLDLTQEKDSPSFGKEVVDLVFFGRRDLHISDDEDFLWFMTTYTEDDTLIFVEGEIKTEEQLHEVFRLFETADSPHDWHEVAFVIDRE